MLVKWFLVGLVMIALSSLTGCTVIKLISASSHIKSGEFDKAAIDCEEALKSSQEGKPIMLKMQGEMVNGDYPIYMCLGYSNLVLGNFDKSKEYIMKGIDLFPAKGYEGYLLLAELNYQNGNLVEANKYILNATKTVGTPKYYEMMKHTDYPVDFYKNFVEGARDFYNLRSKYKNLEYQMRLGNYDNSIKLAEEIINGKYKIYIGADAVTTVIDLVLEGGMADLNGIVKGDKLLEINGAPVSDMLEAMRETDKLSDKYGSTVRYKIERKGRIIDLESKLIYPEIDQAKLYLLEAKEKLANKSNKTAIKDLQGPWIKILEPKSARGIKIVGSQYTNFVILASGKDKIKSVTVNDSACSVSEANLLEKTILPGKVNKYTVSLPLAQGKNKYVVKAVDIKGKTTQQQIEIEGNETRTKELDKIYDHKVAVVIGINKYNPWPGLEYAVNDAEAVRNKLRKMGYDKIIELYNRQATRSAILRVLGDDLVTMLGPNDSLLVYFAGHGQTEPLADGQEEGYIIPVDGTMDNYRGTAISMTYIHSMIKKYKAKHVLFAFDSCYSGLGLKRGGGQKPVDAFIKNMSQKRVRQILTAGGKNEQAAEEKGHGIFTKAFLDSLEFQNSGINKDGYTLASDLGQFVRKQVGEKTAFKQTPMFGWLDGEGDYIFDLNQSSNVVFDVADTADAAPAAVNTAPTKPVNKGKKTKKAVTN